jgi:hypothetical protein
MQEDASNQPDPQPSRQPAAVGAVPAGGGPGHGRRVRHALATAAVALVALGAASRLVWLADMEFKSDEQEWAATLVDLWQKPISPLAPESHHSGVPHSSGFFHFVRVISFASNDPLGMAGAIAGFSALVLLAGLVWRWRTRADVLGLALASTSLTLFLETRKIWTPDLIAAWTILGLLGFSASERSLTARGATWLSGVAAFCFVMAPHMYLSALPAALVVTLTVPAVWVWRKQARPAPGRLRAWVIGALVGWATFVPYLVARLSAPASPRSHPALSAGEIGQVVRDAATLPSPLATYLLYLWRPAAWMRAHHPSLLLDLTLFWVAAAIVVSTVLFWAVLVRLIARWRQTLDSPMAVASLLAWLATAAGILESRLGSHVNYWLAPLPLLYFLMAETAHAEPASRFSRFMRPALWAACMIGFLAIVHFALLVHETGGFPGEYGKSYYLRLLEPHGAGRP